VVVAAAAVLLAWFGRQGSWLLWEGGVMAGAALLAWLGCLGMLVLLLPLPLMLAVTSY
jgi:hypothetical protein